MVAAAQSKCQQRRIAVISSSYLLVDEIGSSSTPDPSGMFSFSPVPWSTREEALVPIAMVGGSNMRTKVSAYICAPHAHVCFSISHAKQKRPGFHRFAMLNSGFFAILLKKVIDRNDPK